MKDFERESHVENIPRHTQCGLLGKKFPGGGRKGGELWTRPGWLCHRLVVE